MGYIYGGYHGPLKCIFSTTYSTEMLKAADMADIYFFQGGDNFWHHEQNVVSVLSFRTVLLTLWS